MNSGTYREWKDLRVLRENWDGPIVLKGIQTVEDARLAVEYGMDGIVVSNHGGRQVDGAIASLDALAEITADDVVKGSGLTVLFDSGIRTGSDVLKALALGAKAARLELGRLWLALENPAVHLIELEVVEVVEMDLLPPAALASRTTST